MAAEDAEDVNDELLYAARTNDLDEVRRYANDEGADVNWSEPHGGSTPLHYASANGHIDVVKFLVGKGAVPKSNNGGNTPLHWACLNKHGAVAVFLLNTFPKRLDVLQKNSHGRSALTYGFKTQDAEIIKAILSHPSAESLEQSRKEKKKGEGTDSESSASTKSADTVVEADSRSTNSSSSSSSSSSGCGNATNVSPPVPPDGRGSGIEALVEASVTHAFVFKSLRKKSRSPTKTVRIRELPIVDKTIFNTEVASAAEDRTGLALWPASIVLSRWIAAIGSGAKSRSVFEGKRVCELGAGCGLPGITARVYGGAAHVMLTDYFKDTVDNLSHNARVNDVDDEAISVKAVDWAEKWVEKPFDVVIGADLVYAAEAVPLLLRTIQNSLKMNGRFLYVCPDERDGLVTFIERAGEFGLHIASCKEAPQAYYKNPLAGSSDKACEMYFPGLLTAKPPYRMYEFVRGAPTKGD
eukprot:g289.t1